MPELPEVETIKNVLRPHLVGRTITSVAVINGAVIAHPSAEEFSARLAGEAVADMTRRGKYMTLTLSGGGRVVLHLRMTGRLTIVPADAPLVPHTHLALALNNGCELRYCDPRRFGRFHFFGSGEADDISGVSRLGAEPFDITPEYLAARLGGSKRPIKALLLDQGAIAGIGNIYSDEICYAAQIRPDRPCNSLTAEEIASLARVIPERISYYIEKNAISYEDYCLTEGKEYRNTPYLQIYGRGRRYCPVCGSALTRAVIGGRSSVYCPECQK